MLLKEVGTNSKEELRTLMRDRDIWRGLSGVDRTEFRHSSSSSSLWPILDHKKPKPRF